jgi:hypothetical protein
MNDDTTTDPADRGESPVAEPTSSTGTTVPTSSASPAGWGAAPTPTSTSTLDVPAPTPAGPYAAQDPYTAPNPYSGHDPYAPNPYQVPSTSGAAWQQGTPHGATPWYGSAATTRKGGPKPPWFWPVIAVAVGLAALLVGGGIGFAVGHAIGGSSNSTTQVPGTNGGTNQLPGGGTGQFPGNGTQGGTGSGTDDGTGSGTGTGSDTSGSSANS